MEWKFAEKETKTVKKSWHKENFYLFRMILSRIEKFSGRVGRHDKLPKVKRRKKFKQETAKAIKNGKLWKREKFLRFSDDLKCKYFPPLTLFSLRVDLEIVKIFLPLIFSSVQNEVTMIKEKLRKIEEKIQFAFLTATPTFSWISFATRDISSIPQKGLNVVRIQFHCHRFISWDSTEVENLRKSNCKFSKFKFERDGKFLDGAKIDYRLRVCIDAVVKISKFLNPCRRCRPSEARKRKNPGKNISNKRRWKMKSFRFSWFSWAMKI